MSLTVYLAAAYSRRAELAGYRDVLHRLTHVRVQAAWLDGAGQRHLDGVTLTPELEAEIESRTFASSRAIHYAGRCAQQDLADVDAADLVVMFTGGGRGGGRHVEVGYAIASDKPILLVGPRENVFHCLQPVRQVDAWPQAFTMLDRQAAAL